MNSAVPGTDQVTPGSLLSLSFESPNAWTDTRDGAGSSSVKSAFQSDRVEPAGIVNSQPEGGMP